MQKYVALGIGGLTLDTAVFRQQRDAPNPLRQGAILVALIGLVVGVATFVGEMGEVMLTRDYEDVTQTLYDGLITMPWYEDLATYDPRFPENFRTQFTTIANTVQLFQSSVMGGALKIVAIPLLYLATWVLYGGFAHIVARLLGGAATFNQTLGATALASSAHLLGVVKLIPFAQLSATTLLALIASYLALRETHNLPPLRTLLVTVVGVVLLCVLLVLLSFGVGYFLSPRL